MFSLELLKNCRRPKRIRQRFYCGGAGSSKKTIGKIEERNARKNRPSTLI